MDGDRWIDKPSDRGRQGSPWTKMSFKLNLFWISWVRIVHQVTKQSADSRSHLSRPWCLSMVDQQELCQFRKPPRSVDRRTHPFSFSLDILLIRLIRSPLFLPGFFMFFPLVLAISPYKNPIPRPSPGPRPGCIEEFADEAQLREGGHHPGVARHLPGFFGTVKPPKKPQCGNMWILWWLNFNGYVGQGSCIFCLATGELTGRPPWISQLPTRSWTSGPLEESWESPAEATVMPTNSQRDGGLWDTNQDVSQHDLLLATSLGKDQQFWPMNSTCAVVKILNKALWNQGAVIQIPAKSPWLRRNCSKLCGSWLGFSTQLVSV